MFGCQRSRHLILLSAGAGADVGWWLSFLPRWNGVSLLPEAPLSSLDLHLFTDVSSRRVGGVFGPRWFSILLTEFASIPWFPDPWEQIPHAAAVCAVFEGSFGGIQRAAGTHS